MFTGFRVCCIAVDHVPGAGLADVAGRREIGVAPSTETAAGVAQSTESAVARIIVAGTARRVVHAAGARATTRVAHAVATEAGPAVVTVTTAVMRNLKPTMLLIAKKTTAKRPSPHDQTPSRTSRMNGKAVPKVREMDPEMVLGVHLLKRLAVAAVAEADHQLMTTELGCCCRGVVTFAVVSPQWTSLRQVAILQHKSCKIAKLCFFLM